MEEFYHKVVSKDRIKARSPDTLATKRQPAGYIMHTSESLQQERREEGLVNFVDQ